MAGDGVKDPERRNPAGLQTGLKEKLLGGKD
jgi:hypothetical protein